MIVLGLDTSTTACSAAIIDGDRVLAARSELMAKGHQERLASLVQELMAQAGLAFDALDRVGVTVGPGSFTGLRVGMAFAKGLALALDVPAVGVGTLEALAATMQDHAVDPSGSPLTPAKAGVQDPSASKPDLRRAERDRADVFAAAIDARRDQVYIQAVRDGRSLIAPEAMTAADAAQALTDVGELHLGGSAAALLAHHLAGAVVLNVETPDPVVVARLAAAISHPQPLRPLYLRAPDAKLPI